MFSGYVFNQLWHVALFIVVHFNFVRKKAVTFIMVKVNGLLFTCSVDFTCMAHVAIKQTLSR